MIQYPSYVQTAISRLEAAGFEAYVVGGALRDALLGASPYDWDVTTSATPRELQAVFSDFGTVESGLKHGTLSTLRNTLGALLGEDMSQSEGAVNEFIDSNCYWEWEYDESYKLRETDELSSTTKCYPLNIQENKTVTKEVRKELSKLRKQHKK